MMCKLIYRPPWMSAVSELTKGIFPSDMNLLLYPNKMGTLHVEYVQVFGPLGIEDFLVTMPVQVQMLFLIRCGAGAFGRGFIPS